jgi:hypothetical protein
MCTNNHASHAGRPLKWMNFRSATALFRRTHFAARAAGRPTRAFSHVSKGMMATTMTAVANAIEASNAGLTLPAGSRDWVVPALGTL